MRRLSQNQVMDKSTTLKIRTISKAAAKDRELRRRLTHWKVQLRCSLHIWMLDFLFSSVSSLVCIREPATAGRIL